MLIEILDIAKPHFVKELIHKNVEEMKIQRRMRVGEILEDVSDDIVFLCHKISGKWWMDLSFKSKDKEKYERHHYIPCSREDYVK